MASARNLCQHSDIDGTQCQSNDYLSCPHCQLQLCLKHLNSHQDLIRSDFYLLCDHLNLVHSNLNNLIFDSYNQRDNLFEKLDNWYHEQLNRLNKIYLEKKQQLQILCIQAQIEFDTYKTKTDKQFKENLLKQFKKVNKQKQIHIDDLNEMKDKLNDIEKGLDELKQLLIDINHDENSMDIQIIKKRYVEAAKTSFNDEDDEDNQWDTDDEDDMKMSENSSLLIELLSPTADEPILLSPPITYPPPPPTTTSCSSTTATIVKKAPLKFIIKRLKQPTTSINVKYQLQTVATSSSPPLLT